MPQIQATGIADILINSLNELGRLKFTDVMSDYQNTTALKRIFKSKKATFSSGPEVQFNLQYDTNGSFRAVALGYVSEVNIPNLLAVGKMPWRHVTWNWGMERRLLKMNSGASKIVDYMQSQRIGAFGDAIKGMEVMLWRCPTLTEFDLQPVGIPYFVVKSATATTTNDGFNGSVPSGYTLVANLNPSTAVNGRWKNYAAPYTAISKDDLIKAMRRAHVYTDFMPLVDGTPTYATGDDYGIYTNYTVVGALEEILEDQNQDLGTDVASMDGKPTFRGSPINFVKQLDLDTTNPVYMLNWGEMGAMALEGEWMKEQVFDKNPNQPTMTYTNVDCSWNLWCRNRRRQAVISNGTTMPSGA